jgi:hypothetical protein
LLSGKNDASAPAAAIVAPARSSRMSARARADVGCDSVPANGQAERIDEAPARRRAEEEAVRFPIRAKRRQ